MNRRLWTWGVMLAVLAAAGCDGPAAHPRIQGDPPPNRVNPLPAGVAPAGPARPAIKSA